MQCTYSGPEPEVGPRAGEQTSCSWIWRQTRGGGNQSEDEGRDDVDGMIVYVDYDIIPGFVISQLLLHCRSLNRALANITVPGLSDDEKQQERRGRMDFIEY